MELIVAFTGIYHRVVNCQYHYTIKVYKCQRDGKEGLKVVEALPAWTGYVVGTLHRMRVSREGFAKEIGISRQRLYEILNSDSQSEYTRSLVENGLRSYAEKLEIDYNELEAS